MKFSTTVFFFLLLNCVFAQPAKHVVLVSIDGFRPDFYMDSSWPAASLQFIRDSGAYATEVRVIFPSVTYPSHTTLITGALPARHGIYYNTPFTAGGKAVWVTEKKEIKTNTLWDAVHLAGLTSASVSWPVSVGAAIDYNLPETWSETDPSDRRGAISKFASPEGLFEEMQEKAIGHIEADDLNLKHFSIDENNSRMASYIIRKYKPSLLTIHIVSVDGAQHEEGRNGTEVRKAIATADHAVQNLLEAIERAGIRDSTAIIVTGDHGFSDISQSLAPNIWLAEAGLTGNGNKENWKALFHPAGGSAFLMLRQKGDTKTLQQVEKILTSLPDSYKKLFRIVSRKELDKIGADPNAAFALAPVQGVSINASASGEVLKPAKGGAHGFFPEFHEINTGFIAMGAGINKGLIRDKMGLEDIAPLVAKLLGIEFQAADGKLVPGIIKE